MKIHNAFELGETVYFRIAPELLPGVVVAIEVRLGGTISYMVHFATGAQDWVAAEMLSREPEAFGEFGMEGEHEEPTA